MRSYFTYSPICEQTKNLAQTHQLIAGMQQQMKPNKPFSTDCQRMTNSPLISYFFRSRNQKIKVSSLLTFNSHSLTSPTRFMTISSDYSVTAKSSTFKLRYHCVFSTFKIVIFVKFNRRICGRCYQTSSHFTKTLQWHIKHSEGRKHLRQCYKTFSLTSSLTSRQNRLTCLPHIILLGLV
jgi:hypothetical protein